MLRFFYGLLVVSLVIVGVAIGCAQSNTNAPPGGSDGGQVTLPGTLGADGGLTSTTTGATISQTTMVGSPTGTTGNTITTGTCPSGVVSVTISPSTAGSTATYGTAATPFTQTFTASATLSDGGTMDATSCVGWNTSDPVLSSVSGGNFSTSSAGVFTVTALSGAIGSVQGTATVTVKVTGTSNPTDISTSVFQGTPSGTPLQIAYPLDGALFPFHFGDLAFQVVPTAANQTLGHIAFQGDAIAVDVYAPCTPIGNAAIAGACSIAIPPDLEVDLAGASGGQNMTETVSVASTDGSSLAQSSPIDVRWASASLPGTIYYWSSPSAGGAGASGASEIVRMNLQDGGAPPEVFYDWLDAVPYSPDLSGGWACVGCHAISQDGTKMGITIGGASIAANGDGNGSFFALVDVASRSPLAAAIDDDAGQFLQDGFAEFTTFSPDGGVMLQELQGALYLRTANAALTSQGPLFPSMTESMTHPYWSAKGDLVAFTSWVPTLTIPGCGTSPCSHAFDSKDHNGNEAPNAQIWLASATGDTFATPTLLVPRAANLTEYYPTISDDSLFVAFNESSCNGPQTAASDGYGQSACDTYDDPSARLRMIPVDGGTPAELDRASGRTDSWPQADAGGTWTNSWPRFSPTHGVYQGKTLYWIAFSSRRPYGAVLAGSQIGTTVPQIWFAGVLVNPDGTISTPPDPSFAPVYLPQQNSPTPEILFDGGSAASYADGGVTANHVPQWVYTYVPYVPPMVPPPPPPR